jgi:hypothetical protein
MTVLTVLTVLTVHRKKKKKKFNMSSGQITTVKAVELSISCVTLYKRFFPNFLISKHTYLKDING